jgi:hypothetical protein
MCIYVLFPYYIVFIFIGCIIWGLLYLFTYITIFMVILNTGVIIMSKSTYTLYTFGLGVILFWFGFFLATYRADKRIAHISATCSERVEALHSDYMELVLKASCIEK